MWEGENEYSKLCLGNNQLNFRKTNFSSKIEFGHSNLYENMPNYNKSNSTIKKDKKNLDLNINLKDKNKATIIKKKKRRFSKKVVFNSKKFELKEFSNIIYQIIKEASKKHNLLLLHPIPFKKKRHEICGFCNRIKLSKEYKIFKISCQKDFKEFYIYIFNIITQEEFKDKFSKLSNEYFNLILENKKDMFNLINKKNTLEPELINKKICIFCIYNSLIKYKGFNLMWETFLLNDGKKFLNIKEKFEIITGLEDLLIKPKNNANIYDNNSTKENSNININNNLFKKGNSSIIDINKIFNEKNANIFDLILEDKNDKKYFINNASSKEAFWVNGKRNNENKNFINNKKRRKNIIGKSKEKKINSNNTKIDNDKLNEIYLNNYLNNNIINNFEFSDNNKSIKNNINSKKRNIEQINPSLFDMNYNYNNNFIKANPLNLLYDYINNDNIFVNKNEQLIYNNLNNQISLLQHELNLKENIYKNFAINNFNKNNAQVSLLHDINGKILYLKNLIQNIFNYIDNIRELLDIYSYICSNFILLMKLIINGDISFNNIMILEKINNLFLNLLNINYKFQMMNKELCDKINI